MSSPQTITGLMRHLKNDCNINISGNYQKQQLISYGYYHGYKGYRFVGNSHTQIPYSNFNEVVAVIEYDNNLKAALYPHLMFIETALKNIVCNSSVVGLKFGTFDHIYKERMNDYPQNVQIQLKRLNLRNSIYSKIAEQYKKEEHIDNKMIRHFYTRGEDAPIWVIFEILYLSDLANFFDCLNESTRENILKQINLLDVSIDTNKNLLSILIFTLKSLRNSVAHNNIIFDTRFKDRKISPILKKWVEKETGIQNITLYSLIDYIIIVCCLLKRVDFSGIRAKMLLDCYKAENDILNMNVSPCIYDLIIQKNISTKVTALENYLI